MTKVSYTDNWPHDLGANPEMERICYDRIQRHNQSRQSDGSCSAVQQPGKLHAEYTLWRIDKLAVYKPEAYIGRLGRTLYDACNKVLGYLHTADSPIMVVPSDTFSLDIAAETFNFGKYKDQKVHAVCQQDPMYLDWLSKEQYRSGKSKFNRILDTVRNFAAHHAETLLRKTTSAGRFIASIGSSIKGIDVTVQSVRYLDDPYKSRDGRFYVDQVVTAVDADGVWYTWTVRASNYSLSSGTISSYDRPYRSGDSVHIKSARVANHVQLKGKRVNRLTYCRMG